MSKRSRRERRPNLMPEAYGAPRAGAVASGSNGANSATAAKPAAPSTSGASAAPAKALDWRSEYGEVVGELKVTFFSAVALVAVMVVLSFIIR